jgi:hypothetical protein
MSFAPHEDLKTHAVFVLSQLPRGEGIPQFLEIAPRAIALFESVLRSRAR